jgi:hypothetical protein
MSDLKTWDKECTATAIRIPNASVVIRATEVIAALGADQLAVVAGECFAAIGADLLHMHARTFHWLRKFR